MLKNKRVNVIIALVLAVVLWLYVIGAKDPVTKVTIKGVPIGAENLQAIEATGFTLLGMAEETVNLTISGSRSVALKKSAADFAATADLEGLVKEGEHVLKLKFRGPGDVEIESASIDKVGVTIDRIVTEEKRIVSTITNQIGEDREAEIYQVPRKSMPVTGASAYVSKVTHVTANLDYDLVEDELKEYIVAVEAVDQEGQLVAGVVTEEKEIGILAARINKKTVPIYVNVTGMNDGGITREVTIPKEIVVKGMNAHLVQVEQIVCRDVNVGNVYEMKNVPLEPVLPTGVSLTNNARSFYVSVKVPETMTKTFSFDGGSIQLEKLDAKLQCEVDGTTDIVVTVTGAPSLVGPLEQDKIILSVDLDGLTKGEHTPEIKVRSEVNGITVTGEPKTVKVVLKDKPEEGD